jgi:sorbitol-specific phosphotransferase system component IIC
MTTYESAVLAGLYFLIVVVSFNGVSLIWFLEERLRDLLDKTGSLTVSRYAALPADGVGLHTNDGAESYGLQDGNPDEHSTIPSYQG